MRRLKMETVYNCLVTNENEILSESIHSFIETTIMDLVVTEAGNSIDNRIRINLSDCDFIETKKNYLYNQEFIFDISHDIFLNVKYDTFCKFELNYTDETEVGLGMTGEICGVESFYIEIREIIATMSDCSEFDLSDCYELKNFLDSTLKYLKISYGR